jgi:hypothetical protein
MKRFLAWVRSLFSSPTRAEIDAAVDVFWDV